MAERQPAGDMPPPPSRQRKVNYDAIDGRDVLSNTFCNFNDLGAATLEGVKPKEKPLEMKAAHQQIVSEMRRRK